MNIHFTDKELFNKLKSATIAKVVVGSNMYRNGAGGNAFVPHSFTYTFE